MGTERSSILFENSAVGSEEMCSVKSLGTGLDVLFMPITGLRRRSVLPSRSRCATVTEFTSFRSQAWPEPRRLLHRVRTRRVRLGWPSVTNSCLG